MGLAAVRYRYAAYENGKAQIFCPPVCRILVVFDFASNPVDSAQNDANLRSNDEFFVYIDD